MDHANKLRDMAENGVCDPADRQAFAAGADAIDRLAALEIELAEARKDSARLRWYAKNHNRVSFAKGCNGEKDCWVWRGKSPASPFYAEDTLHAAIDKAMEES